MSINIKDVKILRDRTGLGISDCRKALLQANGNIEKAIEELRKNSALKAAKKSTRLATEGKVDIIIDQSKQVVYAVEVNCETDFAAKDDNFNAFVETIKSTMQEKQEDNIENLNKLGIEEARQNLVQKIGENVNLRRVFKISGDTVSGYVHNNNKIAVIIAGTGNAEVLANVAMHIAAMNPISIDEKDISTIILEQEKSIYEEQIKELNKPPQVAEKIIRGKIQKFITTNSLLTQPFICDEEISIKNYLKQNNSQVTKFIRVELGEGLEKVTTNFAEEVASQIKN